MRLALTLLALALITVAGASANLNTNLVSYWKADNAYTDSTGFETLTEVGGVTFNTGIINQSFDLDGTNDYVRSNTRTWGMTNNWTYSFWIYRDTSAAQTYLRLNQTSANGNLIAAESIFGSSIRVVVFDNANVLIKDYRTRTTTIGTSAWYHVVLAYGSDLQIYVNGVLQSVNASTNTTGTMTDSSRRLYLGSEGGTGQFLNGRMDEIGFWSTTLNASAVSQLYNGGAGLSYPFGATTLTITAIDNYNSTTLTTFNATVTFNGTTTTYTTTNGSISTGLTVNSSQPANVTVTAPQYFGNVTTNHQTPGLQVGLYPWTVVRAFDQYNSTAITGFTVSYNGTDYATTNGFVYIPYISNTLTTTITVNTPSWYFTNTTTPTGSPYLSSLNATIYPWTLVRAYVFNGTQINNFSANYTNYDNTSDAGSSSTTNGILYLPLYNATYNLTLYDANQGGVNYASYSANATASPYLSGYNFTGVYFTNSFAFTFYNETTDTQLTQNVTLQLISELFSANYTVTGGAYNATLLMPADYQIIYWVDPDVPREYYTTLTNQSVQNLRLYTIDLADRELYSPVALSQFGRACGDQTVSLLRYFINGNAYRVVEMALTDTNGAAVLAVQPNIINYKLQFAGSCGDYTSDPQKITAATNSFTITDGQSPLATLEAYDNIARSLTYNEATDTFIFNWADTDSTIAQACLTVTKTLNGLRTTDYYSCLSASSGSLVHTINDTNQTIYTATGVITLASGESFSDTTTANYRTSFQVFGETGIFLTLLVLILFATFGAASPDLMVISGVAGIALMGVMTFIAFDWTYFVGIVIIALYIAYRAGRT